MNPKFFVLMGPSAVGKNAILDMVLERYDFAMPRGVITREIRPGEINADSDHVSSDRFDEMFIRNELTAVARIHGNLYGTPKRRILTPLEQGQHVIRIFNVDGVDSARKDLPGVDMVTIFLFASPRVIKERMIKRGDSPDDMERRLKTAEYELTRAHEWNYLINADRSIAGVYGDVCHVIETELHKWKIAK